MLVNGKRWDWYQLHTNTIITRDFLKLRYRPKIFKDNFQKLTSLLLLPSKLGTCIGATLYWIIVILYMCQSPKARQPRGVRGEKTSLAEKWRVN